MRIRSLHPISLVASLAFDNLLRYYCCTQENAWCNSNTRNKWQSNAERRYQRGYPRMDQWSAWYALYHRQRGQFRIPILIWWHVFSIIMKKHVALKENRQRIAHACNGLCWWRQQCGGYVLSLSHELSVQLAVVEAAGLGVHSGMSAATTKLASPAFCMAVKLGGKPQMARLQSHIFQRV